MGNSPALNRCIVLGPRTGERLLLGASLFAMPLFALAQSPGMPAFTSIPTPGGGQSYTLSLQTLLLLTALSFLPALLLMMTGFTRIIIVLSLLRQALGTQSSPPNQVLVGLALFLTFFVMGPVFDRIYTDAYQPYASNKITMPQALEKGSAPLKAFMMKQTREADLALFVKLSRGSATERARGRPIADTGSFLRHQRIKNSFSDRFCGFHSFSHYRYGRGFGAHVHGYDDGIARPRRIAIQAYAVRIGRRMAYADWIACRKFLLTARPSTRLSE